MSKINSRSQRPEMQLDPSVTRITDSELKALQKDDPESFTRVQELQALGWTSITVVHFKGSELMTREDFHKTFAERLHFPDFYGKNMDAWIDVMDDMGWAPSPMAKCFVGADTLKIIVEGSKKFRDDSPMYCDLVDCVEFINEERRHGHKYLQLVFE